jgi:hypothetical protein
MALNPQREKQTAPALAAAPKITWVTTGDSVIAVGFQVSILFLLISRYFIWKYFMISWLSSSTYICFLP